jgi:hypothetical protein
MDHQRVQLLEAARIEQQVDSLARRQLAPGVLLVDATLSPAQQGLAPKLPDSVELVGRRLEG